MAVFEYVIGEWLIDGYTLSNQLKTFQVAISTSCYRFLQTNHILSENDVRRITAVLHLEYCA